VSCRAAAWRIALVTLVVGVMLERPAVANCVVPGEVIAVGAAALVAPAHVGADVPVGGDGANRAVIGWSYQVPVSSEGPFAEGAPHRMVLGGDLLIGGGVGGRGRVGYRYATRWLFGGAGVGFNSAGLTLSPEVGVKFAHFSAGDAGSLHVLVRGEVALDFQQLHTATIALGWNVL
jgi:hypothetical protein